MATGRGRQDLDLSIGRGELVALLGPVRLRQDDDDAGHRRAADADLPARSAWMAPTSPAFPPTSAASAWCSSPMRCFPHLSVFENVAFGLRLKGLRG
jgi:putative spermidine/putrescine transport system ATP-binding protein